MIVTPSTGLDSRDNRFKQEYDPELSLVNFEYELVRNGLGSRLVLLPRSMPLVPVYETGGARRLIGSAGLGSRDLVLRLLKFR